MFLDESKTRQQFGKCFPILDSPVEFCVACVNGFFLEVEEHSLTEGMAAFAPIYKLLDRLPAVRNISNKIIVLEKE